jgi:hypothetical protein
MASTKGKKALPKSYPAGGRVNLKQGPWDGLAINTRVGQNDVTLTIRVGQFHGRYRMNHHQQVGVWEDVQVN